MPRRFHSPVSAAPRHKLPRASILLITAVTITLSLAFFRSVTTTQFLLPFVNIYHARISEPQAAFIPDTTSITRTQCILYDRPPRTASTTIGSALQRCLQRHGYTQPPEPPTEQRPQLVSQMLSQLGPRKALLSRHLYLNATSIKLLRNNCHMLLYISSCAPMRRRLWSAVKYSLAGGHGNASLSQTQLQRALKLARNSKRQLTFLNAYPYVDKAKRPLHVYDALVPDYVIRIERLHHDLSKLLEAFGCDAKYVSGNVHQASRAEQQLLQQLRVGDDGVYNRLLEWAHAKNEVGLLKAAVFVHAP